MVASTVTPDCLLPVRSRFLVRVALLHFCVVPIASSSSKDIALAEEAPVGIVDLLVADSALGQFCDDLVSLTRLAGGPTKSANCTGAEFVDGDSEAEFREFMLPT